MNLALKARGLRTWFDEDKMADNIIEQMTDGIDSSRCVVVFITDRYMTKVAGKGPNKDQDNCLYEFQHASISKGATKMIPVVMEPQCKDNSSWFGILAGHLRSKLYLNFTSDEDFEGTADKLHKMILDVIKTPTDQIKFDDGSGALAVAADSSDKDGGLFPSLGTPGRGNAVFGSFKDGNARLNDLSVEEVGILLVNLVMRNYAPQFVEAEVDGETLTHCDSVEDLESLGVGIARPKAKYLLRTIAEYRVAGVPKELLLAPPEENENDIRAAASVDDNGDGHISAKTAVTLVRTTNSNSYAALNRLNSNGAPPTAPVHKCTSNAPMPEAVVVPNAEGCVDCTVNCKWSRFVKFRGVSGPLGPQINGLYQLVSRAFLDAVASASVYSPPRVGTEPVVDGFSQPELCVYMRVGDEAAGYTYCEFSRAKQQWEIRTVRSRMKVLGTLAFDLENWNAHFNPSATPDALVVPPIQNAFQYENFFVGGGAAGGGAVEMKAMVIVQVFNSIEVRGAAGVNAGVVNGVYDAIRLEPTSANSNPTLGMPFITYLKRDQPEICIDFCPEQNQWQIKATDKIGTNSACARLDCTEATQTSFCARDLEDFVAGSGGGGGSGSDGVDRWRVYDGSEFAPQEACVMSTFREAVHVSNCPGPNATLVNGIYDVLPFEDGKSLAYLHRTSKKMCVEFNQGMHQWQAKPIESRGTNSCCASLAAPVLAGLVARPRLDWAVGCWRVYNGSEFAPAPSMIVTTALSSQSVILTNISACCQSKPIINGEYIPKYSTEATRNLFPLLVRVPSVDGDANSENQLPAEIEPDTTVIEYSPFMSQWQVKPFRGVGSNESWALLNNMHMQLPDIGVVNMLTEQPELTNVGVVDNMWRVYDGKSTFVDDPDALFVRGDVPE